MIIQFGLELTERSYPEQINSPEPIEQILGLNGLLQYLERHLGISYPDRNDYLRQEQYRQLLEAYLEKEPTAFFARSFEADAIATANALLERRDELYLADWDFVIDEEMPPRLAMFAEVEQMLQAGEPTHLYDGFAERFVKMKYWLTKLPVPVQKIYLNEPRNFLPHYLQDLWSILESMGVTIIDAVPLAIAENESDLTNFQAALQKQAYEKKRVQADGSLIIIKAKRETYLSEYLAKLLAKNKTFRPLCLIPSKNRALDNSLVEEGLPSFGILSASTARPTLQIIKLVSTFLWKPINPYKILEFVSLPISPIHSKLARQIAKVMAEKPGLNSGSWRRMVAEFFGYYEAEIERNPERKQELEKQEKETRRQFNQWFNRRRYDTNKAVPQSEVIDLFEGVLVWAEAQLEDTKKELDKVQKKIDNESIPQQEIDQYQDTKEDLTKRQQALSSLFEQARKLIQILEALPEGDNFLTYLRLERLVRTINEPATMRFRKTEAGHLPFVHQESAIVRRVPQVLWWNFVDNTSSNSFSKWYPNEQQYLTKLDVLLTAPALQNSCALWQRMQGVLQCQERLILVCPQYIEGREQLPHPLWGDLAAALGEDNLEAITVDLDKQTNLDYLATYFDLPTFQQLQTVAFEKPKPYLPLLAQQTTKERSHESFTSLNSLLYYPYQWVFRYQADFNRSSILSISKENRLKGNLAHKTFEQLFKAIIEANNEHWNKEKIEDWVAEYIPGLLEREGAVLLLYGLEPQRLGFIQTVQQAAWALISMIQSNGWKIAATEQLVEGKLLNQNLRGFVDLVVQRGSEKAIIDLKWQGATYRKNNYKNKEDLQLVIYSKLLDNTTEWAHTAYFIIKDSKMIARNSLAFKEAEVAANEDYTFQEIHQEIWNQLCKTYTWRMEQLEAGKIEVRTEYTCDALEDDQRETMDPAELMALLEMKNENARYDDYRVLINLME